MKKALRKNFYMEIRHSLGRFLSIFFIVAIGCAFFSGIRASEPDMRYSGDAYFDEKNLMDIQVMSTMGLTEDDLDAIRAVDGVLDAEGSYATDVLCTIRGNQVAVHNGIHAEVFLSGRLSNFFIKEIKQSWSGILKAK